MCAENKWRMKIMLICEGNQPADNLHLVAEQGQANRAWVREH